MEVVLLQATGRLSEAIDADALRALHRDHPEESALWKPGKLGTDVEDPSTDPIGSCHLKTTHEGVRVSGILFRTGAFRLSFGRGLAERGFDPQQTLDFVGSCLRLWTGPGEFTLRINLIDARKRYVPSGWVIDPYQLSECVNASGLAQNVHWPHRLSTGPLNRVRFFISGNRGPHIAIDHGGVAQFTGFKSTSDITLIAECFDRIMDDFLHKHPPIEA